MWIREAIGIREPGMAADELSRCSVLSVRA